MSKEEKVEVIKKPLCVFTLSSAFAVQEYASLSHPTSRRLATPYWRRNNFSLPRIFPRFKPARKQNSHLLTKYLTDRVKNRHKESLTLQEVLNIIKGVWNSPDVIFRSPARMSSKKKNSGSSELPSPVLFRRRLSAPETIMRKHVLAQQRSDSQDSDGNQGFDVQSCQWRIDKEVGSDPNLNKKRDHNLMRKSTLLRRLWGSSKPLSERNSKFPTTYSEWQYGKVRQGRSTHSLCSNHSSPEHLKSRSRNSINGDELKMSPTKYNGKIVEGSELKLNNNDHSFETISSVFSTLRTSTNELESEQYSTRSTFSENSDLTYTNTSNLSTRNETSSTVTTTYSSEIFLEENGNSRDNENTNMLKDAEGNDIKISFGSEKVNDSSTQTIDTANVNVISNVQLSQSTLNLIFNQVMQDVQKSPPANININTAKLPLEPSSINQSKLIQVQQVPSFYLKQDNQVKNNQEKQILKYMVSNVGIGTYNKPLEASKVVPRFSALPQSISMEVNVSSGESDKESDNVSLMDSLEDQNSPRLNLKCNKFDEKPVRGELSPILPDNSEDKFGKTTIKPSTFFIPIEANAPEEVKSVAESLPEKVKEKLNKRQMKREQKMRQNTLSSKSDSNYVSASDNGDFKLPSSTLPDIILKGKRKPKPTFPNIKCTRKIKIDSRESEQKGKKGKASKRKVEDEAMAKKPESWISKTRHKLLEPLNSVYSKNYIYDVIPKRIFHKTELNNYDKRIEILEIVECVGSSSDTSSQKSSKNKKSKIPVMVNSKLPSIGKNDRLNKPIYLDFEQVHDDDPKIDQLIANILIDALNKSEPYEKDHKITKAFQINEIRPTHTSRHPSNKYQQIFESIPEERSVSLQSSSEDAANKDDEKSKTGDYKGKAAIGVTSEESIPKGWITFYTLRKSQGSPDSTSDEGKKIASAKEDKKSEKKAKKSNSANNITVSSKEKNVNPDSVDTWTSSDQEKHHKVLPPPRKYRSDSSTPKTVPSGWTVTVSGTTSGHQPPELEMKLRFPISNNLQNNPTSQSDSGVGEENLSAKRENLPYLMPTKENYRRNRIQTTENIQQLPKLVRNKSTSKLRQYEQSYPIADYIEPRQTKTSSRRLLLNRPRTFLATNDYIDDDSIDSNFQELIRKFPESLKVTGSSISPERKPVVTTMSARDLTRQLYPNT